MKKVKNGFTLIELMVVIVIIGILVAIALPNFIAAQDRAKLASVKSNMHTMQTMVETYSTDWGGLYPTVFIMSSGAATLSGEGLVPEAIAKKYYKEFKNPFTGKVGPEGGFQINPTDNVQMTADGRATAYNHVAGAVSYAAVFPPGGGIPSITKYFIYGGAKNDLEILVDKGQPFTLSNN